jgi:hypothetical protein
MANDQGSIPSAFPHNLDKPAPASIRPFTLIASDGKVLRSPEEVTSHLLKPDRLSDLALGRLIQVLSATHLAEPNDRAAEEQPLSFQEPWKIGEFGDVVTCIGDIAVDPFGSTFEYMGPLAEQEFMRRITVCVNACQGVPTEDLERCTGLIVRVGEP